MILLYELLQTGVSHAAFTRAFTELAATARPDDPLMVMAEPGHLQAALGDFSGAVAARLTQAPLISPPRGVWETARFVRRAIKDHPGPDNLFIFLSCDPNLIFVTKLLARLYPGFRCQLVFHGNVVSLSHPRSRNPLLRLRDLTSAIRRANHPSVQFIVLEHHIKDSLVGAVAVDPRFIEVAPHPCDERKDSAARTEPRRPGSPVRFGLLGIAGRSKGLPIFARIACATLSSGLNADFRLIGKLLGDCGDIDLSGISGPHPFTSSWLPRDAFETEVAACDYIMLPYDNDYYRFAASGVFLDALIWRKPVICFPSGSVIRAFREFGPIGYLCEDEAEMQRVVAQLASSFDATTYRAQCEAVDAAHASRLSTNLASAYGQIVDRLGAPRRSS